MFISFIKYAIFNFYNSTYIYGNFGFNSKYIGFSSNHKHPVTGDSFSLIFTDDNQVVHDRMQGWHPRHGENSYIQRRMAAIFADTMRKIFLF